MPIVLAPIEILAICVGCYVVYRVFRAALKSRKVDRAINEVTDVPPVSDEETAAELLKRREKNDRIRKAYGG